MASLNPSYKPLLYDFVANYVIIRACTYQGFRDAILSRLVTMLQAPGATCGILYICLVSCLLFMQSLRIQVNKKFHKFERV